MREALADAARRRKDVAQRHALAQRLVRGRTYHTAVRKRVGKRNAQLYDVRAARHQVADRLFALCERRAAHRQVCDESAAPLGLRSRERLCYPSAHLLCSFL